jgi:hypothetical protein
VDRPPRTLVALDGPGDLDVATGDVLFIAEVAPLD